MREVPRGRRDFAAGVFDLLDFVLPALLALALLLRPVHNVRTAPKNDSEHELELELELDHGWIGQQGTPGELCFVVEEGGGGMITAVLLTKNQDPDRNCFIYSIIIGMHTTTT